MSIVEKLPDEGVVAVVGLQWGDEGKGKIVDLFAVWADLVARGTGGANAGHTIVVNGQSHVFHLVPSAILRDQDGLTNVIGRGVAFDPKIMLGELAELKSLGVSYQNLKISINARLVLPQHLVLDRLRETLAGKGKIGTTGKGIGPAYTDQVSRIGLRVVDMLNPESFSKKLRHNLDSKLLELKANMAAVEEVMISDPYLKQFWDAEDVISVEEVLATYLDFGKRLKPLVTDTESLVRKAAADGKRILLEGAQAALLSIEGGIYPLVTASDSTISGLASGVGLLGSQVSKVFGIVKAPAMTRVGSGVFPTEIGPGEDDMYQEANINSDDPREQCVAIRRVGGEYGATTGRARRIAWLDLPLLRLALISGGDELVLTKLDMMDDCRSIKICTHYIYRGPLYDLGDRTFKDGDRVDIGFGDDATMRWMQPVYVTMPGWQCSSQKCSADTLPAELKELIRFIEDSVNRKVAVVSVGPDREQTIVL